MICEKPRTTSSTGTPNLLRAVRKSLALLPLLAGPAAALEVTWADWMTAKGAEVTGSLSTPEGPVRITYSKSANSISFAQVQGGTDFWTNGPSGRDGRRSGTSPYTSVGPGGNANIPTGTDMIALNYKATHVLTFDPPISNIYFSFVSLNGNTISFDTPVRLLSATGQDIDGNGTDDRGFWGAGDPTVTSEDGRYVLTANGEAHGTLMIPGTFSSLSFTTSITENWHGFTIGVGRIAPPDDKPTVPTQELRRF